ncbi:MAG: hypothetical protein AAGJ40_09240 [Planctomycetota bacterium]
MHEPTDEKPRPYFVGKEFHDKTYPGHSGNNGHECEGGLYVCDDCPERKMCRCFDPKPFACGGLVPAEQTLMFDLGE